MSLKVCQIVNAHMLIQVVKELLLDEQSINQRFEPFQPHLLGQTLTLFNYFWSIEFDWLRATIISFKVCEIVSAHKSIQAGKIDDFDVQTDSR